MTCGIYILNFNNTHKVYVGQSVNIERRYRIHCTKLMRGVHTPKLNSAYTTYGLPTLEIMEISSMAELDDLEQYHIKLWNSVDDGFNTVSDQKYLREIQTSPLSSSKYSKETLLEVLDLLIDDEILQFKDISTLTGVSITTIRHISAGISYKWLFNVEPEKYTKLLSIKGNREKGYNSPRATLGRGNIINIMNDIVSSELNFKEIASKFNTNSSIVGFIAQGKSHVWLKDEFPTEYSKMMLLKGTRQGGTLLTRGKPIPMLVSPSGDVLTVTNIREFGRVHNIPYSSLHGLISGKSNSARGWILFKDTSTASIDN